MGFDFDVVRAYLERRRILRFLDGIVQSGRRAARIVANMLEFSRAGDSGLVPCHMAALLDKSIELAVNDYDLKKKYDFRRITIEREYASGLPKVACDPTRMEQVLFNLLKNAAQAMAELPDEPGRIVLRTRFEPPWVRLEVEDNGPGIPETIRKRVFEPFFTTKPTGSGTGLGLSVSYFIVTETHKGTMSVESAPGHGTRFIIQLPAAKPEE
jgi:signal transduction histidine kinase